MVRAKFRVTSIMESEGTTQDAEGKWVPAPLYTIKMRPVYSDDPKSENQKFWKAPPSGDIELGCINADAAKTFRLGGEYYVDFSVSPADQSESVIIREPGTDH